MKVVRFSFCRFLTLLFFLVFLEFYAFPFHTASAGGCATDWSLVFEGKWSEPKAWDLNHGSAKSWQLWTKEENVWEKRSNGASILTPTLDEKEEHTTPEEGAPPLHTRIKGIPNGIYHVYSNPTNRPLAFSYDGKNWAPGGKGEIDHGIFTIQDGTFEIRVDDRYPSPESRGSAYYDYIRFVPLNETPEITHLETFTLPDGRTQVSWISNVPTPPAFVKINGEINKKSVENHRTEGTQN